MKFTSSIAALACTVAVLLTASAQTGAYTKFTDCAVNTSELSITSFSLSPSPMCLGQDYCITATGALSEPIVKGAKLGVWGKYLNRIVYTDKVDLCDVLAANGQNCPIAASSDVTSLKICLKLKPQFWEGVTTQFDFIATNADEKTIFCQRALDRGLEGSTC
ncbi:hypothetical protein BGZ95_003284 [Linnemannia exigua]|uniref:Phosphatidylglycerol/phosphatidylinositol transfer protein n=1 Tax=Linnemannia exigua TaxID=604196 RepID=A0AAD4D4G7_9FUNG|nr:hypothetical protein BGZ95_003284 [Linnemannia exigua]